MDRLGNVIHLTPAGTELAQDLAQAFGQPAVSLAHQGPSKAQPIVIRILVDRAFASFFLAEHIGQFLLRNPGVLVDVLAE